METRALPARKQAFHPLGDWPAVETWCGKHKGQNLYVAVGTRNGGGSKEYIAEIPALWCDIDFKDLPQPEAKKAVWEFPARPSLVVESGGGYHVYWRLKEPATKEDIPRIEALNRQIQVYLKGDPQATEAARILRLPGSLNFKYDPPRKVKVLWKTDLDWNLDDLADAAPQLSSASALTSASSPIEKDIHTNSYSLSKGNQPESAQGQRKSVEVSYWISPRDTAIVVCFTLPHVWSREA